MSKFDAILKKIEEQMPNVVQGAGQPPKPGIQPKPALNPTQQQEVEKMADQLAKINDPNKIKEILATVMQGITHPQNGIAAQNKSV